MKTQVKQTVCDVYYDDKILKLYAAYESVEFLQYLHFKILKTLYKKNVL